MPLGGAATIGALLGVIFGAKLPGDGLRPTVLDAHKVRVRKTSPETPTGGGAVERRMRGVRLGGVREACAAASRRRARLCTVWQQISQQILLSSPGHESSSQSPMHTLRAGARWSCAGTGRAANHGAGAATPPGEQ